MYVIGGVEFYWAHIDLVWVCSVVELLGEEHRGFCWGERRKRRSGLRIFFQHSLTPLNLIQVWHWRCGREVHHGKLLRPPGQSWSKIGFIKKGDKPWEDCNFLRWWWRRTTGGWQASTTQRGGGRSKDRREAARSRGFWRNKNLVISRWWRSRTQAPSQIRSAQRWAPVWREATFPWATRFSISFNSLDTLPCATRWRLPAPILSLSPPCLASSASPSSSSSSSSFSAVAASSGRRDRRGRSRC